MKFEPQGSISWKSWLLLGPENCFLYIEDCGFSNGFNGFADK